MRLNKSGQRLSFDLEITDERKKETRDDVAMIAVNNFFLFGGAVISSLIVVDLRGEVPTETF